MILITLNILYIKVEKGEIMNFLGSKTIETDRLILKAQTMVEQKKLWEILMMPEVNRYFLIVPVKLREKLKDWSKQEKFCENEIIHANDSDVFRWSIFLKENGECIGRIGCHEAHDEDKKIDNSSVRGVGWLIDPKYQGLGFGTEAAKAMIDFMFNECNIDEIRTGAAICNSASWKIMEHLGFERQEQTKMVQYTFLDDLTEDYCYILTKEKYLKINSPKIKI